MLAERSVAQTQAPLIAIISLVRLVTADCAYRSPQHSHTQHSSTTRHDRRGRRAGRPGDRSREGRERKEVVWFGMCGCWLVRPHDVVTADCVYASHLHRTLVLRLMPFGSGMVTRN